MKYLSIFTLIPAVALCVYIYFRDRAEKEPFRLLGLLFLTGAAAALPALALSDGLIGLFDRAFENRVVFAVDGTAEYSSPAFKFLHDALCAFFAVALPEELFKWMPVFLITRRNKNFDYLFDGIVYWAFLSAGFTLTENVAGIFTDGYDTFLIRAMISAPAQLLFGVCGGFFYTLWHTYSQASARERALLAAGRIDRLRIRVAPLLACLSFAVPFLAHGIFTFTRISGDGKVMIAYYFTVVALYAVCFVITGIVSRRDSKSLVIAEAIVRRVHGRCASEEGGDGK